MDDNNSPEYDNDLPPLPKLNSSKQYRYPKGYQKDGKNVGGKFVSKEDVEDLIKSGKLGTLYVANTGAISNKDIQKYKQEKAQTTVAQGFAQSFSTKNDMNKDDYQKLFDTLSTKLSTKIDTINTTMVSIGKELDQSAKKLINLSTSIFSTNHSQKETIDELYKIMDTKMDSLIVAIKNIGNDSKDIAKPSGADIGDKSNKNSEKNVSRPGDKDFRGLITLNKNVVVIKNGITKLVPLVEKIADKIGANQAIDVPKITPDSEKEKIDTPKPAQNAAVPPVGKQGSGKESRLDVATTGLMGLAGGSALIALGTYVDKFVDQMGGFENIVSAAKGVIEKLPTNIDEVYTSLQEKIGPIFENLLRSGVADGIENGIKHGMEILENKGKNKATQVLSELPAKALEVVLGENNEYSNAIRENAKSGPNDEPSVTRQNFSQYRETKKAPDIGYKPINARKVVAKKILDTVKNIEIVDKTKKSTKDQKTVPGFLTPQVVKKNDKKISKYMESPIGNLSVVNTATNNIPQIDSSIDKTHISQRTTNLSNMTNDVENYRQQAMAPQHSTPNISQPVVINNNTKSSPVLLNKASSNNFDNTKQKLDFIHQIGGINGIGFNIN